MRIRALTLFFTMALALAVCQSSSAAGERTYSVREYLLPAGTAEIGAMTVDDSDNVWLIQNEPPVLCKFVRENGTFSYYTIEGFMGAGFTGMSVDETGTVWFADMAGNRFGAYNEATNKTSTFDFPGPMAPSSVLRRGNTIWLGCKEEVGEWDVRDNEPMIDHFVYRMDSFLYDIHIDRLNNVWAVGYASSNVSLYYRMYDRTIEFAIPTRASYPTCLSIDSGSRLWFVESGANRLGVFDTGLFNFSEYDMPLVDGEKPLISRVATVGDAIWLTDVKNDRVLRFYPDEGRFAAAKLADGAAPTFIEPDVNGTLWIYEAGSKKLASLDVTEDFGTPTPTPTPGPAATAQPSPTATPQPEKTPGFLIILSVAGLVTALYLKPGKK